MSPIFMVAEFAGKAMLRALRGRLLSVRGQKVRSHCKWVYRIRIVVKRAVPIANLDAEGDANR